MSKLEQLKNIVADWFNDCEDKITLDKLASVKNACDEVEKEQTKLQEENKELLTDYKKLSKSINFNDDNNQPKDTLGGVGISFEDALTQFINKK